MNLVLKHLLSPQVEVIVITMTPNLPIFQNPSTFQEFFLIQTFRLVTHIHSASYFHFLRSKPCPDPQLSKTQITARIQCNPLVQTKSTLKDG